MNYLSLFSGIGGFELAIRQVTSAATCLGYCEIDDHPASVYAKHFIGHLRTRDVRDISRTTIRSQRLDLLVAGFPCTDLSIARRGRDGLKGKHSNLFYEVLRVLDELNPKYFIIENVASMPDWERDLITIKLGRSPVLLDAADVSYQQRKRLFWTNFPLRKLTPKNLPDFDTQLEREPSRCYDLSKGELDFMNGVTGDGAIRPWDKGYAHDTNNAKSQCITANIAKGVPSNVLTDRRFLHQG